MTETPCVFVDVQRGGPSTGLPTLPAQADMMQVRWGSHGDYEIIALCPNSPQECFDLTVTAFNYAEQYRCPVFVMMDEVVGHMTEKVVIPPPEQIEVAPRRYTTLPPDEFLAFKPGDDLVPDMPRVGEGYNVHVTGLTHDERGYPDMTPAMQDRLVQAAAGQDQEECRQDHALRRRPDRRRRRGRRFVRHHLARGAARHRDGAQQRREGRQVPPHHCVALPRKSRSRKSPPR